MAGFAVAQNSTTGGSSTDQPNDNTDFDVSEVDLSIRVSWCADQTTNCPKLCGGRDFTQDNRCVAGDTTNPEPYTCLCTNGTEPALGAYANTFVSDQCQARFAACRTQNPGSTACVECGTLTPDDVPMSTSSMAAESTAAATAAGAEETAAPAESTGGANAMVGAEMGVKGVVGVVAIVGLFL
ncbi:MAG: hypothetical protein Q9174_007078 [Haloplaca sp. 1 TL-2023]